jgi:hypothetical protein
MKDPTRKLNRRQFLKQSAHGAGAAVLGASAILASARSTEGAEPGNAFAYDVERFSKTDPKLVRFEQTAQFHCPGAEPRRIAVGPDKQIFLGTKRGVCVLGADGAAIEELPLPGPARCLTVAGDGTLYVGLRDHVEVYDRKRQRTATWETPGKKAWLTGMSVSETELYVADSGSRSVLRYDRSGKLVARIGEKNKERNVPGLIVPSPYLDVKFGRDGLLRINNPGRHCVEVYTPTGDLELAWGKPSAGIEGFCGCCNPIGLALLPDGRCITSEKGLPRVKVYHGDGSLDCVVAGPETFPQNAKASLVHDLSDSTMGGLDAAVDDQGRVYVLDLVTSEVRVMARKATTSS